MKNKRYITYFMMFVSIIMLMLPLIPHHHHSDGVICMKNDITPDCCEHHHSPEEDHCCNDAECATQYFLQQTPTLEDRVEQADYPSVITLYYEPLLALLFVPEENRRKQECIYQELLHSTCFTRATGLRAPPFVFA